MQQHRASTLLPAERRENHLLGWNAVGKAGDMQSINGFEYGVGGGQPDCSIIFRLIILPQILISSGSTPASLALSRLRWLCCFVPFRLDKDPSLNGIGYNCNCHHIWINTYFNRLHALRTKQSLESREDVNNKQKEMLQHVFWLCLGLVVMNGVRFVQPRSVVIRLGNELTESSGETKFRFGQATVQGSQISGKSSADWWWSILVGTAKIYMVGFIN